VDAIRTPNWWPCDHPVLQTNKKIAAQHKELLALCSGVSSCADSNGLQGRLGAAWVVRAASFMVMLNVEWNNLIK